MKVSYYVPFDIDRDIDNAFLVQRDVTDTSYLTDISPLLAAVQVIQLRRVHHHSTTSCCVLTEVVHCGSVFVLHTLANQQADCSSWLILNLTSTSIENVDTVNALN